MPFKAGAYKREYHRKKSREWAATERAKRIAAGVCMTCRTPVKKFRQCVDCRLARMENYQAVERPKLVAKSRPCADCRRRCVRPGAYRCGKCCARRANLIRWARQKAAA